MKTNRARNSDTTTTASTEETSDPAAATAAWVEERTRLAERRPRR